MKKRLLDLGAKQATSEFESRASCTNSACSPSLSEKDEDCKFDLRSSQYYTFFYDFHGRPGNVKVVGKRGVCPPSSTSKHMITSPIQTRPQTTIAKIIVRRKTGPNGKL